MTQSKPELIDRRVREDWEQQGSTDLYARAHAKAVEIVEGHEPMALDADVAARIGQIVEEADREKSSHVLQREMTEARDLIQEYRPESVPDDVAARIHAIVEETDRAAGVSVPA